jgi:succinylarginine dihydrolase
MLRQAQHEREGKMLQEINFDGLIGPTHNYAGLSLGNIASAQHKGQTSYPRAAALQGLAKMRGNMALGLAQGFLLPLPRPNHALLDRLAVDPAADHALHAAAWSASSMWTANAATVSPAPDTADGRCHLTPANLVTMLHRAQEWPDTQAQLRLAFADARHFAIHDAVPPTFGDEGAANHMRLCEGHGAPGVEVFVYGRQGGRFPARQHEQASRTVARLHGLDPALAFYRAEPRTAIAAGAFHNDVVAVANERVLFTHARAFADQQGAYQAIRAAFPALEVVEVPEEAVEPRRSDPHLSVQRAARHLAIGRHGPDRAERVPRQRSRMVLVRGDAGGQRPHSAGAPRRCAPVDGQWRRPGLPAPARRRRSRHGRSPVPAR